MSDLINFDGKLLHRSSFAVNINNRSFKYGDGFFETMLAIAGQVQLEHLHFERLFSSLKLLQFIIPKHYSHEYFRQQVQALLSHNNQQQWARVRLMIYRDGDALNTTSSPHFVIESTPIEQQINALNYEGYVIDIYPDARKAIDQFANLKSNNYQPYFMAALFARKNQLHDSLILNSLNRIADATIANIFIVKNQVVTTPPLSEGCVAGVYRRNLLHLMKLHNITYKEKPLQVDDLLAADEVFLTNAVRGIKWVKQFRNTSYGNNFCKELSRLSW